MDRRWLWMASRTYGCLSLDKKFAENFSYSLIVQVWWGFSYVPLPYHEKNALQNVSKEYYIIHMRFYVIIFTQMYKQTKQNYNIVKCMRIFSLLWYRSYTKWWYEVEKSCVCMSSHHSNVKYIYLHVVLYTYW